MFDRPTYEELEQRVRQLEKTEAERIAAEKALRESEEKFRNLVESANDIVYTLSPDGIFTYVSPNWQENLGHDPSEVVGKSFALFVHPDDIDVCRTFLYRVMSTGEKQSGVEYRARHKNGSWRWHMSNGSPLTDAQGRILSYMGIAHDTTRRKAYETRLKEREEQFRTIFYHSPQPMALTAAETGELIDINDVFCSKIGAAKNALLGRTTTDLNFYSVQDRKAFADEMMTKGQVDGLEMSFTSLKGDTIIARMYATFITVNSQKYILTIFDDITGKKEAEREIQASLNEKEILLRELYHRTKNNMQIIVSMINMQTSDIEDKNILQMFEETKSRINAMALVHEKLYRTDNLSRIDLKAYFTDLVDLLAGSCHNVSENVTITSEMETVYVTIDTAIPCGLIMNELVSNAFQHAFPGNRNGQIHISLKIRADGKIEFIFSDNGVGLPDPIDIENAESMGLRTIAALAEHQLSGAVRAFADNGTHFSFIFRP